VDVAAGLTVFGVLLGTVRQHFRMSPAAFLRQRWPCTDFWLTPVLTPWPSLAFVQCRRDIWWPGGEVVTMPGTGGSFGYH